MKNDKLNLNIENYFNNSDSENSVLSSKLGYGPYFCETIKDFYKNCIKKEFIKINLIKTWDKFLNKYININKAVPIYLIRKYESVGDKFNGKQNNRRGCLTLVVDKETVKFAYAFISNYDAQELYNMIKSGINIPDVDEFLDMLQNGNYQVHYSEKGNDCQDNLVSFFDRRGNIHSGVVNMQNWYLAHIIDVNGVEYKNDYNLTNAEINNIFFPRGCIKDWKDTSSAIKKINNFKLSLKNTNDNLVRKARIINIEDVYKKFNSIRPNVTKNDINKLYKKLLDAHFLRFVHPLNYFLVPSKKCEVNGIYGRKNISIGEFKPLIEYIRNAIRSSKVKEIFQNLENKLMLPNIINKGKNKSNYGDIKININYGSKYKEYIFLDDEQSVQVPSEYKDIEDFFDKINSSSSIPRLLVYYGFNDQEFKFSYKSKKLTQQKLKNKLINELKNTIKIKQISQLDYIKLKSDVLNTNKPIKQQKSSSTKRFEKYKIYSYQTQLNLAKIFLENNYTYKFLDVSVLKCPSDRHGATSWSILNKLGLDKTKRGVLVSGKPLDDEIKNSEGQYKKTLLNIKKYFKL